MIFSDKTKIAAVNRFKRSINFANVMCPLLVVGCSLLIFLGEKQDNGLLYDIGSYGWLTLLTVFTLTWGWTLYKLYMNTVHSEKLLPDKRIFILHGSLLVFFLLMNALNIYAYWKASNLTGKAHDDWGSVFILAVCLGCLIEAVTFGLVIFLMIPVGDHQKFKRQEFQRFLFVGFVDRTQLEEAIRKQYPDLSETELSFISSELDCMESMMTESSTDITGGMVTVRKNHDEHDQLAFRTWMDVRLIHA